VSARATAPPSFQLGDFLMDATVTANGKTLVEAGALAFD
jgi:hypothetical protein